MDTGIFTSAENSVQKADLIAEFSLSSSAQCGGGLMQQPISYERRDYDGIG
jgi:hypothetical protein